VRVDAAALRLCDAAERPFDVAVIAGSGLSDALADRIERSVRIPYHELQDAPLGRIAGHRGEAIVGTWAGRSLAAFAGRVHLYQGYSAYEVTYFVRLAAVAGVKTLVLTNAAGGLNPAYSPGDLMIISDQINLTGTAPSDASDTENPFVSMIDAYSPRLRALAQSNAPAPAPQCGVYAGVHGPAYETPAEARRLRTMGADAVGMSTVLETIAARRLGLDVFGVSLITNVLGTGEEISHDAVLSASRAGSERMARLIEALLREPIA
jgi:purine-nucleoside phosphorylase